MNSFSKIFGKRRSSSKAKDDEAGEVDIEAARMELAQAALAPFPPGFSATDPAQLKAFKESQLATLNKYLNPLPNAGMVAWFKPESWRDGDKQWHDASGHGHVGRATGDVRFGGADGHGAKRSVEAVSGGTGATFDFGGVIKPQFTIASVCRYTGGARARILQGTRSNWLHSHWGGHRGVAHYDGWKTAHDRSVCGEHEWVVMIGSNAGAESMLRANGQVVGQGGGGSGDQGLVINAGRHAGEKSDWSVSEVITWERGLTAEEVAQVERYLFGRLGWQPPKEAASPQAGVPFGTYRIKTTHHGPGQQPAGWGLACFPNHGAKRNDASSWVHVHVGDHWPCQWELRPGQKPGTYRIYTLGHGPGGQAPGWGLSAWHAHGAERNGSSSWVAVHSGEHWPMDWTIVPGKQPGTWRILTTQHAAGKQAAGWGLSAWNAHGAKRNDHSSRVAVHNGDHWPMDWVLERVGAPGDAGGVAPAASAAAAGSSSAPVRMSVQAGEKLAHAPEALALRMRIRELDLMIACETLQDPLYLCRELLESFPATSKLRDWLTECRSEWLEVAELAEGALATGKQGVEADPDVDTAGNPGTSGAAFAPLSSEETLARMGADLRRELGLGEVKDVGESACEALGMKPAGTEEETIRECYQAVFGETLLSMVAHVEVGPIEARCHELRGRRQSQLKDLEEALHRVRTIVGEQDRKVADGFHLAIKEALELPVDIEMGKEQIEKLLSTQLKPTMSRAMETVGQLVEVAPVPNAGMVAWFKPESWRDGDKQWHDASGHGHVGRATGDVRFGGADGHGAKRSVEAVSGGTGATFDFGGVIKPQFTIASVCRYTGGARARILQGTRSNWLHSHWGGHRGVAHYDGWKTAHDRSVCGEHEWVVMIGSNAGAESMLRANGQVVGQGGGGSGDQGLVINAGRHAGEKSDWSVSEVITWERGLTAEEVAQVERYLFGRLGWQPPKDAPAAVVAAPARGDAGCMPELSLPTGTLYGPWMGGEFKAEVFKHVTEDLFIFVHFSSDNFTKMVATKTSNPAVAHGKPRVLVGHRAGTARGISDAWDRGQESYNGTDLGGKYLLKDISQPIPLRGGIGLDRIAALSTAAGGGVLNAKEASKALLKLQRRIEHAEGLLELKLAREQMLLAANFGYGDESGYGELTAMRRQMIELQRRGIPRILARLDELMVRQQLGHAIDEIGAAAAIAVARKMPLQQLRGLLSVTLRPLLLKYSASHGPLLRFRTTRTRDPHCGCLQIAQLIAWDGGGRELRLVDARNPNGHNPPNEEPAKALDGNARTKWLDGRKGALECRLEAGPSFIARYAIATANDCPERDPVRWVLEGRQTEAAPWRVIDDKSGADQPTPGARFTRHEVTIAAMTAAAPPAQAGAAASSSSSAAAAAAAAGPSSADGALAGDAEEQARLVTALRQRPEMLELEEKVREVEALIDDKEHRDPIPLVPAVEPPVRPETVACLATPMGLPRELELVHVLNGSVAERVCCPQCRGTGRASAAQGGSVSGKEAWAPLGGLLNSMTRLTGSLGSQPTKPARQGSQPAWLFEGLGGKWHCYDAEITALLEDACAEGPGAVLHVVSEEAGDFELVINLETMVQTSVLTGEERRIMREGGGGGGARGLAQPQALFSVAVPDGARPGDALSVRRPDGSLLRATVPDGAGTGATFHVRAPAASPAASRQTSTDSLPRVVPVVTPSASIDGLPSIPVVTPQSSAGSAAAAAGVGAGPPADSAADPRIIEVRRGKSANAMFMAATAPDAVAPPPELPVYSMAQLQAMSEEAQLSEIRRVTEAQAAHASLVQRHGKETAGRAARRRRELLAAATPGIGVEARIVFSDGGAGVSGGAGTSGGGAGSSGCGGSGSCDDIDDACVVCRGTGRVCAELTPEQAAAAAAPAAEGAYDCQICGGDGEYCISSTCGAHFFCADCIQGTLKAAIELGQFPAQCPVCRVEAGGSSATNDVSVGRIDDEGLSFLAARGVIPRELLFRFAKAARSSQPVAAVAAAAGAVGAQPQPGKARPPAKLVFYEHDRSPAQPDKGVADGATAWYGAREGASSSSHGRPDTRTGEGKDVTAQVRALVQAGKPLEANNVLFGDPAPGKQKVLELTLVDAGGAGGAVVLKHNAAAGHWWFGDYDDNGSVRWPYGRNDWAAGWTTHLATCEIDGEAILLQHNNDNGGWHFGKYNGQGSVSWYRLNNWQAKTTTHALFFRHQGKGVVLKHNAAAGHWWFGDYDDNGSVRWPYGRNDWAAGWTTHLDVCEVNGQAILLQHNNNNGVWHWGVYDGKGSAKWFNGNPWQAKTTTHSLFFASPASINAAPLRWGARVRGELIDVSADGTVATDVARNPKQGDHVRGRYRVVAAERGFSRGRHEWSVRLVKRGRILVGVATGEVQSGWHEGNGKSLHQLASAWTVCVCSRYGAGHYEKINRWHRNVNHATGLPNANEGDAVGIVLDCDTGTLTFTVNGRGGNNATFTGLPAGTELFPVVSFGGDDVAGCSVQLEGRGAEGGRGGGDAAAGGGDAADATFTVAFSACPAGCGQYLLEEHTSYRDLPVKLGEFYNVGDSLAIRLGECPTCEATICVRCKSVVPAGERRKHMCRHATAEADPATKALLARIGKKCPACGKIVEKTEGCHIMMCGTNAHGKVADALRNGGCAFIFDWNTMKECEDGHGYHDINGVWQRGKGPRTDRQVLLS